MPCKMLVDERYIQKYIMQQGQGSALIFDKSVKQAACVTIDSALWFRESDTRVVIAFISTMSIHAQVQLTRHYDGTV